ncbi:hypothetical protein [Pedobacter sp. BMA]|uniref:hypothetical protein n=1 Tax=Pedobacter sp. BMA TaxID=1663685 RepID=UPI00064A689F|nr:hypothetical protein [Pedobacter sp. BMA]KLT66469.1 hypothetical protein AB669_04560 [Pedobacter sp. BMA]
MNITECRTLIIEHNNLKGSNIEYNGLIYRVLDVIAVPAPALMEMYLIDYSKYKDYDRAISRFLTHKDLDVALYCKSSAADNPIVILLKDSNTTNC